VLRRVDELDPTTRNQLLDDVLTQLTELTTLVGDLAELARGERQTTRHERFRLDQLVDDLVAVGSTHGRTRGLEIEADLHECWVFAHRERVSRAVGNLLNNAIKWSPEDGIIDVGVSDGVVTVRDRGPGIADADLPKIFDRFYRSPAARALPGSGLGLAIVAQVATEEGGTVSASNAPGGGALLRFELPTVS
jgi:two-component system sensor histidine kinase MprB